MEHAAQQHRDHPCMHCVQRRGQLRLQVLPTPDFACRVLCAQAAAQRARLEAALRHAEGALAAQQEKGRGLADRLAAAERASRLSVGWGDLQ